MHIVQGYSVHLRTLQFAVLSVYTSYLTHAHHNSNTVYFFFLTDFYFPVVYNLSIVSMSQKKAITARSQGVTACTS